MVSILSLEVVFPKDGRDDPRVRTLIDGAPRLESIGPTGWIGFGPDELLASKDVLIPGPEPHRIAVARCSCGEPGCGSLAPIITASERSVTWSDFRDFTGVFWEPRLDHSPDPEDGSPLDVDDVEFDRAQYTEEVARAVADLSWESPSRRTARLLGDLIRTTELDRLAAADLRLEWVGSHWFENDPTTWTISLHRSVPGDPFGSQVLVSLRARTGTPEERATRMHRKLTRAPVRLWDRLFPHRG